ncbi:hypothetical protein CHGG_03385 [Chaetomium globosum CBS 148.51]|uniref:Erythromycin esterase n=1 Tax=Chaetomium globosum (strain ATCC 6205 / CBS 148.51 / DSM 1962 / NBRC 6347 / NRRL 1970) TaxID=306901 RepID=Q2H8R9_CHAGB|nr:uncharacterized protein CHGG_03385 [Chaetomium globosum CBS 148.51]EAQ91450.1 hypothetical protein CHGG_03385 [Chaetomium globosum CBS 148.51]
MARRSARLASLTKAPQQVSETLTLSSVAEHDENSAPAEEPAHEEKPVRNGKRARTKKTARSKKLAHDETPADIEESAHEGKPANGDKPVDIISETVHNVSNPSASSPIRGPKTPRGLSPIRPSMSEMHPGRAHTTMAPPSSGLRLGFTDIKPKSNGGNGLPVAAQTTPTRVTIPSSLFTFRVPGEKPNSELRLGPEAQRIMDGLREKTAKIKENLRAQREAEKQDEENSGERKIAQAKGKAGRYSAAHMAEFKKMDSIANHPSVFRGQPGHTTPLKAGVKRSQSKANLDEVETPKSKVDIPVSGATKSTPAVVVNEPRTTAKRARQNVDEDASSKRPVSRVESSIPAPKSAGLGIPRSKSTLASLMTPTKSSLSRATSVKTPSHGSLIRSPSKASGIPRSATTNNLPTTREIKTPRSRFDKVKAMLRGAKASATKPKSTLPLPSVSKTPAPVRLPKELPVAPMTTPGRKLTKRVAFTPDTQRAALTQNSPSPIKSSILQGKKELRQEVHYPSLEGVLAESAADTVTYPDISARRPLPEPPVRDLNAVSADPPVPGEFTFRSDYTISFGSATKSFGSSPGQASVRAVRPSILPTENMPGSFPTSASASSIDKENEAPRSVIKALPHGMSTKKRHRVSTDEEEARQEAAERAAKKQKQEKVPEGDALLAPRLIAATSAKRTLSSPRKLAMPGQAPGTPSPMKRKGISLSRLNMLARPKARN